MIPHAFHTLNVTKSLLNFALLGVVTAAILTSFLLEKNVAFRYRSVDQATENLTVVQTGVPGQYDTAWQKLKSKSEAQIVNNDKKIEQFKAQRAKANKGFRVTYDRRLAELERRNIVLKARLNDYKGNRGETWTEAN